MRTAAKRHAPPSLQVHAARLQGGASWPMENYFQAEAFNLDKVLDEFEQNEGETPPCRGPERGRSNGKLSLGAAVVWKRLCNPRANQTEFEQHSQVVIESMWRGNRTNWTIHLPEDCGKLCYQSKTKRWSLSPLTLAVNNNWRLSLSFLKQSCRWFLCVSCSVNVSGLNSGSQLCATKTVRRETAMFPEFYVRWQLEKCHLCTHRFYFVGAVSLVCVWAKSDHLCVLSQNSSLID